MASIAALAPSSAVAEQRAGRKQRDIKKAGGAKNDGDQERQKRARAMYKEAEKLSLSGEYEQAMELYQESYRLSGRSAILISIANTYERMGRFETAAETFRRYLATAAESEQPAVRERIRVLEERANAQARAAKPEPIAEPPEKEPPAPVMPQPAPLPPVLITKETPPRESSRPTAGWVLVGTGTAALATGAAFAGLVYYARQNADCKDTPVSGMNTGDNTYLCSSNSEQDLDRDRQFSLIADISLGVGAVALVAGITVFILHDPGSSDERVSLAIHPTGAELTWRY